MLHKTGVQYKHTQPTRRPASDYYIGLFFISPVREVVEKFGYTIARDDDPLANLIWSDLFVSTERITELKNFQRLNHFPGMGEICRKDSLARNMAKYFPHYTARLFRLMSLGLPKWHRELNSGAHCSLYHQILLNFRCPLSSSPSRTACLINVTMFWTQIAYIYSLQGVSH